MLHDACHPLARLTWGTGSGVGVVVVAAVLLGWSKGDRSAPFKNRVLLTESAGLPHAPTWQSRQCFRARSRVVVIVVVIVVVVAAVVVISDILSKSSSLSLPSSLS